MTKFKVGDLIYYEAEHPWNKFRTFVRVIGNVGRELIVYREVWYQPKNLVSREDANNWSLDEDEPVSNWSGMDRRRLFAMDKLAWDDYYYSQRLLAKRQSLSSK